MISEFSASVSGPTEGAASTLVTAEPDAPGFLRLSAEGTNAVASFLKSRNCGADEIVAAPSSAPVLSVMGF